MLIVGDEIFDRNLLLNADKKHVSNATYYLSIDRIIHNGKDVNEDRVVIGPNEVAWVVSKEHFNIETNDVIALVSLKSSLTKKGFFALDTGFVDPRFKGPIGTVLVNFTKNRISISKGEEFFRVIFLPHAELTGEYVKRDMPPSENIDKYVALRSDEIDRDFGRTFLNFESVSESIKAEILKQATEDLKKDLIVALVKNYWWQIMIAIFIGSALSYGVLDWLGPYVNQQPSLPSLKGT
jgi:deoxycytidine triphosphate deaminase